MARDRRLRRTLALGLSMADAQYTHAHAAGNDVPLHAVDASLMDPAATSLADADGMPSLRAGSALLLVATLAIPPASSWLCGHLFFGFFDVVVAIAIALVLWQGFFATSGDQRVISKAAIRVEASDTSSESSSTHENNPISPSCSEASMSLDPNAACVRGELVPVHTNALQKIIGGCFGCGCASLPR